MLDSSFSSGRHQRVLKRLFLVMIVLNISYVLFFAVVGAWYSLLGPVIFSATLAIAHLQFRKHNFNLAGLLIASGMLFAPAWCIWFTGGAESPLLTWLLHGPVLAGILVNWIIACLLIAASIINLVAVMFIKVDFQTLNEIYFSDAIHTSFFILASTSSIIFLCIYIFIVMREVSDSSEELQAQNRKIARLAHHDHLTKLPNRLFLQQQLERLASEYDRYNTNTAILFVDLDDFKRINDVCGHAAGDQLLIEVAQRLRKSVRASDIVTRLGGDEFAVLLLQIDSPDEVGKIALKMIEALSSTITVNDKTFTVSASIGISMLPKDAEDPNAAMRHADMAMYEAKKMGKNNFHFFDETLQAEALNKIEIQSQLLEAVSHQQFILHYQPIVETSYGKTVGYEALLRWEHPAQGTLYPNDFIEVAEHSDVIFDIGYWVIDEACRRIKDIADDHWISVNVSARQFNDPDLVRRVKASVGYHQINPNQLVIEATESSLIDNIETAIGIMNQLQQIGVRIAMDDFGTGYSSLALLKQLPIDLLKIDRSFVNDLENDTKGRHVIRGVVSIARDLNLTIIAEGVETQQQFAMIRDLKSDYCQGYFFSKPKPFEELDQLAPGFVDV